MQPTHIGSDLFPDFVLPMPVDDLSLFKDIVASNFTTLNEAHLSTRHSIS